jgi:hypothetical protein
MSWREGDSSYQSLSCLHAHHSAWTTSLFAGDPATIREHCEAGRRHYDPERHCSHRLQYGGHDPGVCGRFIGGQAHWLLRYPEKGLALASAALALAERIAHPFSLASALLFNGVLHLDCSDLGFGAATTRRSRGARGGATTWLRRGTAVHMRCRAERTGNRHRYCGATHAVSASERAAAYCGRSIKLRRQSACWRLTSARPTAPSLSSDRACRSLR